MVRENSANDPRQQNEGFEEKDYQEYTRRPAGYVGKAWRVSKVMAVGEVGGT